jgi:16S rRNA (guanine527-N7)-methyltransferase
MTLAQQLAQGVKELGIALPAGAQDRLLQYLALLQKWNRVYNLTAVREPQKMVSEHLLDCLAVTPYIGENRILDVGSGAGLPGIPLAVALPAARFEVVISRALSDLCEFVALAGRHVAAGGCLAAMKGVHPYDEIAQLPSGWRVRQTLPLAVPGLRGQRHLVLVEPV